MSDSFVPDANSPERVWIHIGGDLEASYDGARYVDIRGRDGSARIFISKGALEKVLTLFNPLPICD